MGRDKGTGSIYRRKSDKRWFAQLTVEVRTITKSSMDQRIVKQWLKERVKEYHQGTPVTSDDPTVDQYLREWARAQDVEPRTQVSFETTIKRVVPYIGHVHLSKLRQNEIREMWDLLQKAKLKNGKPRLCDDGKPARPLAATSLATSYAHLKRAFDDAIRAGEYPIRRNPFQDVKPVRGERREMNPLTEDEVRRLLQATKDDPEYPIWLILISTGMRVGELVGLKWQDVSLDRATITVRRGAYRLTGRGIVDGNTKTKKGRSVDLPKATVAALRSHRERQHILSIDGYVFTTETGSRLDPRRLNSKFDRALENAGLERRKLHNTRHTYATLLFARNEHPKVVQEQLGHSSIKITLDVYSAYIPTMGRSAADRMDAVLA